MSNQYQFNYQENAPNVAKNHNSHSVRNTTPVHASKNRNKDTKRLVSFLP